MDSADIRAKVKQIIAERTGLATTQIGDEALFKRDLGFDSLTLLDILVAIDFEFRLELSEDEMPNVKSVHTAVDVIARRRNAAMNAT